VTQVSILKVFWVCQFISWDTTQLGQCSKVWIYFSSGYFKPF
jgi:hypothetical protein